MLVMLILSGLRRIKKWLNRRSRIGAGVRVRIVHAEDGFSFLGFDIRRHVDRQGSGKLLITHGKEQVKRLRERLSAEVRAMRGANAVAVMHRLNPVIRGGRPTTGAVSPAGSSPG
jgi:RNA-directed DNA polymerase